MAGMSANVPSRLDRYRELAAICARTGYQSAKSVRKHNNAADEMRRIASEPGAANELAELLTDPAARCWLAYQLIELGDPAPAIRDQCLSIIRNEASKDGPDALGAQIWLQDRGISIS